MAGAPVSAMSLAIGDRGRGYNCHLCSKPEQSPQLLLALCPSDPGVSRGTFHPELDLTPAGTAPPQQRLLDTLSFSLGVLGIFVFWTHTEVFLGDPPPAGIRGAGLERAGRTLAIPSFVSLAEHPEGCSASSSLLVCPPGAFWDGPGWRRQFLVSLGLSEGALGSVTITQPGC